MNDEAILSSCGNMTSFSFGGKNIRFTTPACLDKYVEVKEWDFGYIVVTARYSGEDEEDYIDLLPISRNLYIDVDKFLKPIK